MKTLLILRHAKSDRSDTALHDHDRPLASRGEADAPLIGAALTALDATPDCIVTSTAVRARETARLIAAAMAYDGPVIERDAVYGASVAALLDALRECGPDDAAVLLVGHNPGLEELAALLTGGAAAQPIVRLPTAALARIALDIDDWPAIHAACGQLEWLLTPRVLRPLMHAPRHSDV